MRKFTTVLLVLIFLIGLSLLLYPTVSDWWNTKHQTKAIEEYASSVAEMNKETYESILKNAREYNENLNKNGVWSLTLHSDEELADYESQLDPMGTGMMGYIDIPKIDIRVPIYHGTDVGTLSKNIGHIEGSALPVGGEGTHCVLSGHRGLTSARLFTDIDLLTEGDVFMIHVLNETLVYQVDQILTVLPNEISALAPTAGKDYCTLVTCTPYGVNSHRLLVRGVRVDDEDAVVVTGDAYRVSSLAMAPIAAAPILLVLFILLFVRSRRKGHPYAGKNPFVSPRDESGLFEPELKNGESVNPRGKEKNREK